MDTCKQCGRVEDELVLLIQSGRCTSCQKKHLEADARAAAALEQVRDEIDRTCRVITALMSLAGTDLTLGGKVWKECWIAHRNRELQRLIDLRQQEDDLVAGAQPVAKTL
jgi:hypothetical protein